MIAAGDLEEGAFVPLQRPVVPGEVRCRGVSPGRQQRHDRWIVAADAGDATGAGIQDLGDEIAFAHADFDLVDDTGVHRFDDPGGLAHVVDLGRAFDRSLPVDQGGRIDEAGIGQMPVQRAIGRCCEPVIVHLDADSELVETAGCQDLRQDVHRVALGRLHVVVRIADDVVVPEISGPLGAVGILAAAEPERLAVRRNDDGLVHVERPAVIAGQPVHVGRIADDQQLDVLGGHRLPGLGETLGIFDAGELEGGRHRLAVPIDRPRPLELSSRTAGRHAWRAPGRGQAWRWRYPARRCRSDRQR